MRTNNKRVVRGATAIAALAAFGTLTACSSGQPAGTASPTPAADSSTAPQALASTSGGTKVTGGADAMRSNGAEPASGEALCATAEVGIGIDFPHQGSADQKSLQLLFRNDSEARCTIQGFPGVQFAKRNGETWDLVRSDDPITPVSLAPGESTNAQLVFLGTDVAEGTSHWAPDSILVTPPNTTDTQSFPWGHGTLVRQDGATHPGTHIGGVGVVEAGNK
ncbi:DUF4232 domain-containing protein [Actinosynnema pretiosum subsp. pretiosum]|uniref:DUF4232 domain-containing protein n=2 Tax=Actinosynnema TaxID=40566 RepID=C6WKU7_ACTMD|nr:DUF4232 domain-containing protein [Actinosynnema mirum]ACU34702.1 hypothetical protein Amir_0739 [Actinosynnema mirum DSM 43827]AXX28061.1 putative lipoprotein [Actinosynnema pretiosum subsp. pretiosum]QUF07538.1 DUF4232 domain-containing protein [Actinosynnema pretiosum subsp. pretiosum]